jgi:hypothetical protein
MNAERALKRGSVVEIPNKKQVASHAMLLNSSKR